MNPKKAVAEYWKYETKIKELYAQRDKDPKYLKMAIQACYEEIEIAKFAIPLLSEPKKEPVLRDNEEYMKELMEFKDGKRKKEPNLYVEGKFEIIPGGLGYHAGFLQLCRIRAKEENWEEVLSLATQAKSEGWYGDWDKRIEKATKKLKK